MDPIGWPTGTIGSLKLLKHIVVTGVLNRESEAATWIAKPSPKTFPLPTKIGSDRLNG